MLRAALLLLSLASAGCMARVPLSGALSGAQSPFAPTAQQAASDPRPHLWYVGLGLYDESWSEGDVTATADLLARRVQGFQVVPVLFSYGPAHRYPVPGRANVDAAMADIARRAGPDDVVLLYLSTHGAPGLLARDADGRELEPADAAEVGEWLAPLGGRPTVLVLSACFSGSFIPALRADNRIILAAARADRTSFGCQAGARHTVFGDAVLDALATPAISLETVVRRVRADVTARERAMRVTQPSQPQVSIGPAVVGLYQAPVF